MVVVKVVTEVMKVVVELLSFFYLIIFFHVDDGDGGHVGGNGD